MKVLMILSNPFLVDPRVQKEAKALLDAGHEVMVIVWDRHGEYEPEDVVDGIRVVRIHNDLLMRVLPSDLFRNPLWWLRAYKKALAIHGDGYDFDVVHCHDLDTLQTGVWLKRKLGCRLVYDAHEIFGYMIEETAPRIACWYAFRMEKRLVKQVDHIITVDEPFQEYFQSIADCSVTIVMNCKDLVYEGYERPSNEGFTLVYVGIMTRGRFFPELLDVVHELDGVRLVLAGKKEGLYFDMQKNAKKFDDVEFLGTIPSADILPLTRKSDATCIIVDPASKQHKKTVFNKQFEAMVCGRPIIVTKGTYAAELTETLECGVTVNYEKSSVRDALQRLRDDPDLCEKLGRNAFKAAQEQYNWEIEKEHLTRVYEEIS